MGKFMGGDRNIENEDVKSKIINHKN